MIRAMKRGRHVDDVLDAGTPLAGRPSTVRNRRYRPVGTWRALYVAMPSTTVPGGTIRSTAQYGQMTQPRLHGIYPAEDV